MRPVAIVAGAAALLAILGNGCGGSKQTVNAPFAVEGGVASGPGSGLWGDGSSGPSGMHVGCIRGRRLALVITVRNRTKHEIMLLGGGGAQRFHDVIERVAVQVRLASPPPTGDAIGDPGLRRWSRRSSLALPIPAGRRAWVQSNFLMRNCSALRRGEVLTVNRSIALSYRAAGSSDTQAVSVAAARILLRRGPVHPSLPINQIG